MKKVFYKLFPKFFKVTTYLDLSTMEPSNVKVIDVDPKNPHMTDSLGIPEERAKELFKELEIQFIKCGNVVEVMVNMTANIIKHPNESFLVSYMIFKKQEGQGNPLVAALMDHLRKGGKSEN